MENSTNITLSDAERNKELFEYEMTQVILQLKGEFARISGKDIGMDVEQLAAPQISLPEPLPNVVMTPPLVNQPIEVPSACTNRQIPEVQLPDSNIVSPAVPIPSIKTIPSVRIDRTESECPVIPVLSISAIPSEKTELDYPNVSGITKTTAKEVVFSLPSVSFDSPKVQLASIPEITLEPSKVTDISSEIKTPSGKFEILIEPVSPTVPDAKIQLPSTVDVNVEIPQINVPQINVVKQYASANVQLEPISQISVPAPPIAKYNAETVKKDAAVQVDNVTVPQMKKYTPTVIQSQFTGSTTVHTPAIKAFQPCSVQVHNPDINVSLPRISIPEMKATAYCEPRYKAENVEVPMAPTVVLPIVTISSFDSISIPETPNVSSDIENILESVKNITI